MVQWKAAHDGTTILAVDENNKNMMFFGKAEQKGYIACYVRMTSRDCCGEIRIQWKIGLQ